MLVVHHLNNSRSQRVLWLLEELGFPYEIRHYSRDAKTQLAPPELRAVHPLGKSPVLTDGDAVIAETGAILDYLVEKAGGRMRPAQGSPERLRYTYWTHYAEGSLMPPLVMRLILSRLPERAPAEFAEGAKRLTGATIQNYVDPQLSVHFDYIEAELAKSTWFAGEELTAADVMMSFPLEAGGARAGAFAGRPRIEAFVARCHARPAFRTALEKGGPYAYAQG